MTKGHTNTVIGATHSVCSKDGTTISYLSLGTGPAILVIPGVLSMAADYAVFARALAEHFTVHTIERRGRGESGPQGDDYLLLIYTTLSVALR
jgi:pimeloyl-ACP methyl ester carboxylesterase